MESWLHDDSALDDDLIIGAAITSAHTVHTTLDAWLDEQNDQGRRGGAPPGVPTTLDNVGAGALEAERMLQHDEQYCLSTTRLRQRTLRALIDKLRPYGLEDSRVGADEKLIIFLDYCANKKTHRELRRIYQHSHRSFTRFIDQSAIALTRFWEEEG